MQLLSPTRLIFPKGGMLSWAAGGQKFVEHGFEIEKDVNILHVGLSPTIVDGVTTMEVGIGLPPIPEEVLNEYNAIQTLINHCINNAENIKQRIEGFLLFMNGLEVDLHYASGTLSEELTETLSKEKSELIKMDFMASRGAFSDFLKNYKPLKDLERYNTNKKIKAITRPLFNYINDRNIYTHGKLMLWWPENKVVIESKENDTGNKIYWEINREILESNSKFYIVIRDVVNEVWTHYHRVRTH